MGYREGLTYEIHPKLLVDNTLLSFVVLVGFSCHVLGAYFYVLKPFLTEGSTFPTVRLFPCL